MIFVTAGIGGSDEIVEKVDRLAIRTNEKFVVVIGKGNYIPKNCKWFRYIPSIVPYVKQSRVVIAHGGVGTLFECLSNGARVISVAKEHIGDHQTDIIDKLSKEGYLIKCKNLDDLEILIKSNKKLKKYVRPESTVAKKISEFLGV